MPWRAAQHGGSGYPGRAVGPLGGRRFNVPSEAAPSISIGPCPRGCRLDASRSRGSRCGSRMSGLGARPGPGSTRTKHLSGFRLLVQERGPHHLGGLPARERVAHGREQDLLGPSSGHAAPGHGQASGCGRSAAAGANPLLLSQRFPDRPPRLPRGGVLGGKRRSGRQPTPVRHGGPIRALTEYGWRRKRRHFVKLFGKVDFRPDWDYKKARLRSRVRISSTLRSGGTPPPRRGR